MPVSVKVRTRMISPPPDFIRDSWSDSKDRRQLQKPTYCTRPSQPTTTKPKTLGGSPVSNPSLSTPTKNTQYQQTMASRDLTKSFLERRSAAMMRRRTDGGDNGGGPTQRRGVGLVNGKSLVVFCTVASISHGTAQLDVFLIITLSHRLLHQIGGCR